MDGFSFVKNGLNTMYNNKIKNPTASGTTVNHNTIGFSEVSSQPLISSKTNLALSVTIIEAMVQAAILVRRQSRTRPFWICRSQNGLAG
jgi:hypothetical protein